MLLLQLAIVTGVKYCSPDTQFCADIQVGSQALSIAIDFNNAAGWASIGTGPDLENSNLFIVYVNGTEVQVVPKDSETEENVSVTLLGQDSDFQIKEKSNAALRTRILFVKLFKSPFFTSKINKDGPSTFNWALGSSDPGILTGKLISQGRFTVSSFKPSSYVIDDSGSSKAHGALMIISFLVFLPASLLLRKSFKSHAYYKYLQYSFETLMWLFSAIGFIVIVVAKKEYSFSSPHSISAIVFFTLFLASRLYRYVFGLQTFDYFNLPHNPRVTKIYYLIDICMILVSFSLSIAASIVSFSLMAYVLSLVGFFCIYLLVAVYFHFFKVKQRKFSRKGTANNALKPASGSIRKNRNSRNSKMNSMASSNKNKDSMMSALSEISVYTLETNSPTTMEDSTDSLFNTHYDTIKRKSDKSNVSSVYDSLSRKPKRTTKEVQLDDAPPLSERTVKFRDRVSYVTYTPEFQREEPPSDDDSMLSDEETL